MKISSRISTIAPATKPLNVVAVRVRGAVAGARCGCPAAGTLAGCSEAGAAGCSELGDRADSVGRGSLVTHASYLGTHFERSAHSISGRSSADAAAREMSRAMSARRGSRQERATDDDPNRTLRTSLYATRRRAGNVAAGAEIGSHVSTPAPQSPARDRATYRRVRALARRFDCAAAPCCFAGCASLVRNEAAESIGFESRASRLRLSRVNPEPR